MFKFIAPRFIFRIEKWKWNKEFRLYVSTMGHFRDEHKQPIPVKVNHSGYVCIKTRNGYVAAHRLVMKTWRPTEDMDNLTVDHLDHNKRNNSVENLEWVSEQENKHRAKEDFIPSIMKKDGAVKKKYKENPQRYKRRDYKLDDLLYYINDIECDSIDTAIEVAEILFAKGLEIDDNPGGMCLEHFKDNVLRKRFVGLLNCCNNFNSKVIDGEAKYILFKYLEIYVRVKEEA